MTELNYQINQQFFFSTWLKKQIFKLHFNVRTFMRTAERTSHDLTEDCIAISQSDPQDI